MYNGIGLQTPRGSGTNGYIQTNKFFVKPRPGGAAASGIPRPGKDDGPTDGPAIRKANRDILEHDRKRRIQLRLIVLEETLVDQGYTASEIAERLAQAKEAYEAEAAAASSAADTAAGGGGGDLRDSTTENKRFSDAQTHQVALRKEKQSELFRAALKITRDQPAEPEIPQQKSPEKISDSGSEDSGYEEREEQEKVSKDSRKQLGRDFHGLADQEKEKIQRKRAPAEEASTKDVQRTKTEIVPTMDETEKSKHNRNKDGKSREYSDSGSDSSRRKGRKERSGYRKEPQGDTSEDDSRILGNKKRKYVNSQKKSNAKHHGSSSGSEGDSGSEHAHRETKKHVKLDKGHDSVSERYRHDSDLGSERNTRNETQAGKYKKRQRPDSDSEISRKEETQAGKYKKRQKHDSEDSRSDIEKKNTELLKIKQVRKQTSSRRHDSESSETDSDIEKGIRDLKGKTKLQIQENKGRRHDSEDSYSDASVEKKRKGNSVGKHTEHRASKGTEGSDSEDGGNKKPKSRVAKREKSECPTTEDSENDSFDSDSSTGSDSSTDYSQDRYGRNQRRDVSRKADTKVIKVQQRHDSEEHVKNFRSSRRNDLERDHHNNDDCGMNEKLEASRRMERNEWLVAKRDFNDDDRVSQETRRKRMRDGDELDKLPHLKRNMGFEASEGRKQKDSRGRDRSGHRDYSRSREDRKKEEYSSSNKLEERREFKARPKEGTGSRNFDRDSQGDDASKSRKPGDHSQHPREGRYEHDHADGDRHRPDISQHRKEERHQREETYKSSCDGDPNRDRYKYPHSQHRREERYERSRDGTGHYDRHWGN